MHSNHLEAEYGAGPHTISVPRMRPADGSDVSLAPPYAVDDANFKKLVAILRIAVPFTGMILRCACSLLALVPRRCAGCVRQPGDPPAQCLCSMCLGLAASACLAAPASRLRCGGSCCAWA
jgi:hypothetical protein